MLSKSGMIEISKIKLAEILYTDIALKYLYNLVSFTYAILNGTL